MDVKGICIQGSASFAKLAMNLGRCSLNCRFGSHHEYGWISTWDSGDWLPNRPFKGYFEIISAVPKNIYNVADPRLTNANACVT